MDDKRLERALSWAGSGGTALALGTLLIAAMYATTPDGRSPVADIAPCFSAGCTTAPTTAHPTVKPGPAKPAHNGRVTPSATSSTTAKHAPVQVTAAPGWSTSLPNQKLSAPVVAMAAADNALVMVGSDGGVFPIGEAGFFGSLAGKDLAGRIAGVAVDPVRGGYWLAGDDGGVFSLNASYYGSLSKVRLSTPVVGIAATPTGSGYWLASADGGVFGFGDARFLGSLSRVRLAKPVVAIMSTPTGEGYWLVSADGGVFPFGDAKFVGSLGGHHLAKPVVAAARTATGRGYWLASADGGVFNFGDATYHGNAVAKHPSSPVSAIAPSATGGGYWLADQKGAVYAFGDARQVVVTGTQKARPAARPAAHAARRAPAHAAPFAGPRANVHSDITEYRRGQSGYDISMYQCSNIPPPAAVSVVQVTGGGLDQPPNPCYVQEAQWAGPNMSAYIYMDGLPSSPPATAWSGPAGTCSAADVGCQSYNYGFNEAALYVRSSRMQGVDPKLWWLDVERYSNWTSAASNALVIRGALDGLKAMHTVSGVYSTRPQWEEITGGMRIRGEMEWVPGAGNMTGPGYSAFNMCHSPGAYTFGGGVLEIVQFGYQGPFTGSYVGPTTYDQDYACW